MSGGAIAQATGKLNDTGQYLCANASANNLTCGFADNDSSGYPRQDGEIGRAPKDLAAQSLGKTGASDANSEGYDYQKLAYTGGTVLAAGATLGTGANWGCTKDVVTGLIWRVKVTTASDASLNTSTFNWKDSTATRNGGNSGVTGTAAGTTCFSSTCDTEAHIAYINGLGICGETANDWRLPTRLELMSLIDASKQGNASSLPLVDPTYFPNMQAAIYWTGDNVPGNSGQARTVNFASGMDGVQPKTAKNYVILVRP